MTTSRRLLLSATLSVPLSAPFIRPARAARTISFAGPAGDFQTHYEASVIEGFRRSFPDIVVYYFPVTNSFQTLGALRTQRALPQMDVAMMDAAVAKIATDEGLLERLTPDTLPIGRELLPQAFIPGVAGPAAMLDNLVLLYAPDKVRSEPTSWKLLWDNAHARQVAMPTPPDALGIAFTLVANKVFGGGDYRESLNAGLTAIGELSSRVQTWDPKPDPYGFILDGGAALSIGWNSRGQSLALRSFGRLAAAIPDEGSVFQINTINLVRGGPETDAGRLFLSYALSAEAQKAFTERMFHTPVNTRAQIAPNALARTAATPGRMAKMMDVNWSEIAKLRESITEQWRRRIARLR